MSTKLLIISINSINHRQWANVAVSTLDMWEAILGRSNKMVPSGVQGYSSRAGVHALYSGDEGHTSTAGPSGITASNHETHQVWPQDVKQEIESNRNLS